MRVKRDDAGDIQSFTIVGHAGYADAGEDIVCAAVSGISFGAINAIYQLLGAELSVEQGEDGYLRCRVPRFEPETDRKVQLLLDGMIASLRSVAVEYGQFVQVKDDTNYLRRWHSC